MIKVSAPGKMIILGEYAVLHGAPALVYTVNRRAYVTVQRLSGTEFLVSSPSLHVPAQRFVVTKKNHVRFDPNLDTSISHRLNFFSDVFENILTGLNSKGDCATLEIELVTNEFYSDELHSKLGFGSSAAMTVALTFAAAQASNLKIDNGYLFRLALQAHRLAQGNLGSGIDIAASYYGSVLDYKMNVPPEEQSEPQKVEPWDELPLAVVWTGSSASTSKMVQSVAQLQQSNPVLHTELIDNLSVISAQGIAAYKQKNIEEFLLSIKNFSAALGNLGRESNTAIISKPHLSLTEIAEQNGCAYKPSGAGGGDIGLLFAPTKNLLEQTIEIVEQNGFKILDVALDKNGVMVNP